MTTRLPARMLRCFAGLISAVGFCLPAAASSLQVQVVDAAGQPLADAVVYAEPAAGPQTLRSPRRIEIEQKGRQFIPMVTVIQTGTEIAFPNRDTVRHHVYSYSQAKTFDIKLYAGGAVPSELFDKSGTVVLGCNIHDQMIAYIQVVSTPWFGKTDASGRVKLEGLPAGAYKLKAWHYGLPPNAPAAEQALAFTGAEANASFRLNARAMAQ